METVLELPKKLNKIVVTPDALLALLKKHGCGVVPMDTELVKWQVKTLENGDKFHMFRLVVRSSQPPEAIIGPDGKPRENLMFYIKNWLQEPVFRPVHEVRN